MNLQKSDKDLKSLFNLCHQAPSQNIQIRDHSKKIKHGDIFVATAGFQHDGHLFIEEAIQKGASTIVLENKNYIPKNFQGSCYLVSSTKKILPHLLGHYFDFVSEKLFCIGITGTNGKTSMTYMIEHIFSQLGWKAGVIGTINHHLNSHEWSSSLTTPTPIELHQRLNDFYKLKAHAAIMEVSSIGLDQHRVDEICFNLAIFTNMARDHLDYHKTMDDYFRSKRRFFEIVRNTREKNFLAILNTEDSYGQALMKSCRMPFISYGKNAKDFRYQIIKETLDFIEFKITSKNQTHLVHLPFIGAHNVSNATGAVAAAVASGFSFKKSSQALESFQGVQGRLQRVPCSLARIFVDYAHTPDALKAVLLALRNIREDHQKIITVFGCGGGRDQGKRKEMAKVVQSLSDFIVVTSDNPRGEDPIKIIEDILKHIQGRNIFYEVDRKDAIQKSLEISSSQDIILVAGKGHENYQIIGNRHLHFNDVEEIQKLIQK